MSLLGNAVTKDVVAGKPDAAEKKAKRDAKKQKRYALGLAVKKFVEESGKPIPTDVKEGINLFAKKPGERSGGGFGGTPAINKLFGAEYKVGDKITLMDVFKRTKGQGISKMSGYIRKWKKSGIEVDYQPDEKEPANSVYVITKLP